MTNIFSSFFNCSSHAVIYGHCSSFCHTTLPTKKNLAIASVTTIQAELSPRPVSPQAKQAQHLQSLHLGHVHFALVVSVALHWTSSLLLIWEAKTGHSITSPISLTMSYVTTESLSCSTTADCPFACQVVWVHTDVWEHVVPMQFSERKGFRTFPHCHLQVTFPICAQRHIFSITLCFREVDFCAEESSDRNSISLVPHR